MGQCGAAFVYFVPCSHFSSRLSYPFFLSPHLLLFFFMRSLCTDFLSPCFSLPCWFMYHIQCPLCAVLVSDYPPHCENQHQAVSGVCCPLTQKIYSPSCSLPWHLKFFTFLTTGTHANKMFIGTKYDLKLAHK